VIAFRSSGGSEGRTAPRRAAGASRSEDDVEWEGEQGRGGNILRSGNLGAAAPREAAAGGGGRRPACCSAGARSRAPSNGFS